MPDDCGCRDKPRIFVKIETEGMCDEHSQQLKMRIAHVVNLVLRREFFGSVRHVATLDSKPVPGETQH